jgi:hypothetical protein
MSNHSWIWLDGLRKITKLVNKDSRSLGASAPFQFHEMEVAVWFLYFSGILLIPLVRLKFEKKPSD